MTYLWINLCRIEPRVYEGVWADPRIRFPMRINRIRLNMLLSRLQTQWEPQDLYTKHIQRLIVNDLHLATTLLPLCRNLTSLALWFLPDDTHQAIMHPLFTSNTLSFPKLRRLYLLWKILPPEQRSFQNPIFWSLTHLELDYGQAEYWSDFSSLKNLTNLCLNCRQILSERDVESMFDKVIHVLVPNLPSSLKYFTVKFEARCAAYAKSAHCSRIWFYTEVGRYDSRLLIDWSSLLPERVFGQSVLFRCSLDFVFSWLYPPSCYKDYWRRAELDIEFRNSTYGSWM